MVKRLLFRRRKMTVSSLKLFVDRFEGDFAVCENSDGERVNIERKNLPDALKEQDWLTFNNNEYIIDEKLTEENRSRNLSLYNKLKKER